MLILDVIRQLRDIADSSEDASKVEVMALDRMGNYNSNVLITPQTNINLKGTDIELLVSIRSLTNSSGGEG
jgi:hypothetical protein